MLQLRCLHDSCLHESCLHGLTKHDAGQLATACRGTREALAHWLFLHHARPHTSMQLYRCMLHELRRMGLLPLYLQLHSPLQVAVLGMAFAYYKDRQSHFSTPSISRFFRFSTPPATMAQAQEFTWKQSRTYLHALQASLQSRQLFSYLAVCEHDPEHAERRYPLGTQGLLVLEQLVSDALWPRPLLLMLLRELKAPPPLLWYPLIAVVADRFQRRGVRRQQQRAWRRLSAPVRPGARGRPAAEIPDRPPSSR